MKITIAPVLTLLTFAGCGANHRPVNPSAPIQSICESQAPTETIFVAAGGQDTHPGTQMQPLKTLKKAQEKVRELRSTTTKNITVYLREGDYPLDRTLEFSPQDAGKDNQQVIYRAFGQEQVVLSGGQAIEHWEKAESGLYKAAVSDRKFRQLYINGQRAIRARTPNLDQYLQLKNWDVKNRTINLNSQDVQSLGDLTNAEMVIQRDWNQSRLRVERIQIEKDNAIITPQSPERDRAFKQEYPFKDDKQPYHWENSMTFLDAPGEWYLDQAKGEVFYKPRRGETIDNLNAIAPNIETLINIQGSNQEPVKNLAFCGLAFQHTTWLKPNQEGYIGTQAGIPFDSDPATAAIVATYAHNLLFERNIFKHLGGMGLLLSTGTQNVTVNANVMTDISDNGLSIGIPIDDTKDPQAQIKNHRISNNYITKIGQDYFGSVGIFASYASGLRIEHNELTELPYTAISVGWGWTDQDNSLRDNLIQYNHIHRVMKMLFDGGAIYTLSKQPGTVIAHNYIQDLVPSSWVPEGPERQWLSGIYLDQGSSFMRLQNNVIQNVPTKITEQSVAPPAKNNTLINNDKILTQVKALSGIQAKYRNIKQRL
jgi:hypothetical protein